MHWARNPGTADVSATHQSSHSVSARILMQYAISTRSMPASCPCCVCKHHYRSCGWPLVGRCSSGHTGVHRCEFVVHQHTAVLCAAVLFCTQGSSYPWRVSHTCTGNMSGARFEQQTVACALLAAPATSGVWGGSPAVLLPSCRTSKPTPSRML